jgi:hypothetical protein
VRTRLFVVLLIAAMAAGAPAAAQEESPGSGDEEECRAGELCGPTRGEDPFEDTDRSVVDPPGNHVRSLITIGLIAAFLGSYLFVALTGRKPFRRSTVARPPG